MLCLSVGCHFVVTRLTKIQLVTAEFVPNRKTAQLAKSLRKLVKLYARGGFIVRLVLMDKKFDNIEGLVGLLATNTKAAREYVSKIERDKTDQGENPVCHNRVPIPFIPKKGYSFTQCMTCTCG